MKSIPNIQEDEQGFYIELEARYLKYRPLIATKFTVDSYIAVDKVSFYSIVVHWGRLAEFWYCKTAQNSNPPIDFSESLQHLIRLAIHNQARLAGSNDFIHLSTSVFGEIGYYIRQKSDISILDLVEQSARNYTSLLSIHRGLGPDLFSDIIKELP